MAIILAEEELRALAHVIAAQRDLADLHKAITERREGAMCKAAERVVVRLERVLEEFEYDLLEVLPQQVCASCSQPATAYKKRKDTAEIWCVPCLDAHGLIEDIEQPEPCDGE